MVTGERTLRERIRRIVFGPPRDLDDRRVLHRIALIPFLAWVGLGADGLSSSCYGPEEAFRTLGEHTYLALALAAVMSATVFVIAIAYSRVIEQFPHGGGGYVVATKLLGEGAGVLSGSALLVDYVLTITISIAAAGDALFSFLPRSWHVWKLAVEILLIFLLIVLNLRGVRESVITLVPIFLVFVVTHVVLIAGGIIAHLTQLPQVFTGAGEGFSSGLATLGAGGMFLLFIHAYSLGGGTYTGIEAVSNGLTIMREPRVQTGKRTMLYMAASLAFTASGLLLCYLLWDVRSVEGKTLNAVLVEQFVQSVPLGNGFVILTLISEGALLIIAGQAGFVDGPRVLANMAVDSWVPRRFAALSERLATQNGILLMGVTSLAALVYTHGDVRKIVVMYSINVFITFCLTETAMCSLYVRARKTDASWIKKISIHVVGLSMCLTILSVTLYEKFEYGGWLTLLATGSVIGICTLTRRHYRKISVKLNQLQAQLSIGLPKSEPKPLEIDTAKPTAALLVGGYSGLGMHTMFTVYRAFPGHFRNFVFMSVGVVDSGEFKGAFAMEDLRQRTAGMLQKYVNLANQFGVPAAYRFAVGTDVVDEAESLCLSVAEEFSNVTIFAGQILFQREGWLERLLHNQTAFAIQRRVQWAGRIMVILPIRLW